jgi:DNA-binding HxlR family transcriptional regulator
MESRKKNLQEEYEIEKVIKVLEELTRGLNVLKNSERFRIIRKLYNESKPLFFSQIKAEIKCSSQMLSYHLKLLEEAKIISNRRELIKKGKLFSSSYELTDYEKRLFRFLSSLPEKRKQSVFSSYLSLLH